MLNEVSSPSAKVFGLMDFWRARLLVFFKLFMIPIIDGDVIKMDLKLNRRTLKNELELVRSKGFELRRARAESV